jgi:hypothetical protein
MVTLVLPYGVLELGYYLTAGGESPFESWFDGLDVSAAAKVSVALVRCRRPLILENGTKPMLRYYHALFTECLKGEVSDDTLHSWNGCRRQAVNKKMRPRPPVRCAKGDADNQPRYASNRNDLRSDYVAVERSCACGSHRTKLCEYRSEQ